MQLQLAAPISINSIAAAHLLHRSPPAARDEPGFGVAIKELHLIMCSD